MLLSRGALAYIPGIWSQGVPEPGIAACLPARILDEAIGPSGWPLMPDAPQVHSVTQSTNERPTREEIKKKGAAQRLTQQTPPRRRVATPATTFRRQANNQPNMKTRSGGK